MDRRNGKGGALAYGNMGAGLALAGAGCDAQKGFPGGISEGLPGVFPVVSGGFRVDLSVSFPMVFPMEAPEDIPRGFRLFFRALPGDR